jgi:hypothetical protein
MRTRVAATAQCGNAIASLAANQFYPFVRVGTTPALILIPGYPFHCHNQQER